MEEETQSWPPVSMYYWCAHEHTRRLKHAHKHTDNKIMSVFGDLPHTYLVFSNDGAQFHLS